MSDKLVTSIVTVLIAIIGVASLAVLLSPNANTGNVIQTGGGTFANALNCALSPITGGSGFFGGPSGACGNTSSTIFST